jgi:chemotaxis protein methyltransferase CheR
MPHLHLGRIARRQEGRLAEARRELGLALGLLPAEDAANILLFGGGFPRDALIQICRAELVACKDAP